MKYRITVENEQSTRFSYIEEGYDSLTEGEWEAPFPNDSSNSTAFELAEGLLQADRCPPDFYDSPIVSVKVRKA